MRDLDNIANIKYLKTLITEWLIMMKMEKLVKLVTRVE